MLSFIRQAITANGGTPQSYSRIGALRELVTAYGGTPTQYSKIGLLREAITAAGGTPTQWSELTLLRELLTTLGQTVTSYRIRDLYEQLAGASSTPFAPTITSSSISGTPEDGQTLTAQRAANGNPAPTYTYQWQVNGTNISGQTAQTITLDEAGMSLADGDTISCEITATNSEGSDTAEPTIAYVYVAPPDVTAPTITSADPSGTKTQGATVSGTLTADETVTWSKSGTDAASLTLDTSTGAWSLDTSALGSLAITVTATDGSGNASSQSWTFTVSTATATAPTLTQTSTAGTNPLAWDATYTDVVVGSDYIAMRWRVNGGAWTDETDVLIDSDFVFDYGYDNATYPWPLYSAHTFSGGDFVEVQEGIVRAGATTWSTILSDTLAAAAWTPDSLWLASENGDWWDVSDRSKMFQDTAGTTPVTAVGQTVKRWVGKRGNLALTSSVGLALMNDGTKDYLYGAGSGSNATLATTSTASLTNASGELTAFGSFKVASTAATHEFINSDDGGANRLFPLRMEAGGQTRSLHWNTGGTVESDYSGAANVVTANTRFTTRTKHKTGTPNTIETWCNNASDGATNASGTLKAGVYKVGLFSATGGAGAVSEGKVYNGFCIIGRATTTTEDADIETWCAA